VWNAMDLSTSHASTRQLTAEPVIATGLDARANDAR
jgi:hypothetical protein